VNKQQFFGKHNCSDKELKTIGLSWEHLSGIYEDHNKRTPELLITAQTITAQLVKFVSIHSLKHRIKDPEHLIEKIVRKKRLSSDRDFSLQSYRNQITDLIGVRALHLYKDDWVSIHDEILNSWELLEGNRPIAFICKGDDASVFTNHGCEVEEHSRGYRSVHYVIKLHPTKTMSIAEIQVRTIFEEGWSEVDHRIAYPNSLKDPMLTHYLGIFNALAGNADSMATFIKMLSQELTALRNRESANATELRKAIVSLEKLQEELGAEKGEKKRLEAVIALLRQQNPVAVYPNMAGFTGVGGIGSVGGTGATPMFLMSGALANAAGSTNFMSPVGTTALGNALRQFPLETTTCDKCGNVFTYVANPPGSERPFLSCPNCGTLKIG
jgi:ppGpp synthetase/RelA/SpoT-type nucleotidyltranferase